MKDDVAISKIFELCYNLCKQVATVKFSELVRLLERNGFRVVKEKGSVRYYGKEGWNNLIRVDYHGSREVPTGTFNAILKAAGLKEKGGR